MPAPSQSQSTTHAFAPARRSSPGRHVGGIRQSRVHAPPIGTRRPETPNKRVMDIEDVLRWAFVDELPKRREDDGSFRMREFPSVCPMFAMAQHGGRIENFTREPGFPAAMGEPHPDALIVEAAVLGLSRFAEHRFDGDLGLGEDRYLGSGHEPAATKSGEDAMRRVMSADRWPPTGAAIEKPVV